MPAARRFEPALLPHARDRFPHAENRLSTAPPPRRPPVHQAKDTRNDIHTTSPGPSHRLSAIYFWWKPPEGSLSTHTISPRYKRPFNRACAPASGAQTLIRLS